MQYKCDTCEKVFKQKSNYNSHINKKVPCEKPEKDVYITLHTNPHNSTQTPHKSTQIHTNLQEIPEKDVYLEIHTTPHNSTQKPHKSTQIHKNSNKKPTNNINKTNISEDQILLTNIDNADPKQNTNIFECPHCLKSLSRSDALHRHITKYCNVIKEKTKVETENNKLLQELLEEMKTMRQITEEVMEENKELKEKNKELEKNVKPKSQRIKQTQNIIASNSNINSNNTIIHNHNTIVAFDTEDFNSVINNALCSEFFKRGRNSMIELLKYTHFNKDLPQFHNCYISNSREHRGLIYDGDRWLLTRIDEIIDKLIEKNDEFLVDKYDELKDKLGPITKNQFERYLKLKKNTEEDKINREQYKDEMKNILYNNAGLVVETRKRETERLKELKQ
jgi:uncharacterized C2H2 Zn-finger protein